MSTAIMHKCLFSTSGVAHKITNQVFHGYLIRILLRSNSGCSRKQLTGLSSSPRLSNSWKPKSEVTLCNAPVLSKRVHRSYLHGAFQCGQSCGFASSSSQGSTKEGSKQTSTEGQSVEVKTEGDPVASSPKTPIKKKELDFFEEISFLLDLPSTSNTPKVINVKEWDTVYRFPQIKMARAIQRLKLYQTGFTCLVALPCSVGCYMFELVGFETVEFIMLSSLFACGMLYVMGTFCSRLIGFIYTSKEDPNLVRVAHLNFYGHREDKTFKKTDFVPFSDLPDNIMDAYVNVKFYSNPKLTLNICVRYGDILDEEKFHEIFGLDTGGLMKKNKINSK